MMNLWTKPTLLASYRIVSASLLCVATLGLCGCSASIRVRPLNAKDLDANHVANGLVYYLLTSRMVLTVPCTVVETTTYKVTPKKTWNKDTNDPVKRRADGTPCYTDEVGATVEPSKDGVYAVDPNTLYVLARVGNRQRHIVVRNPVEVKTMSVPDDNLAFVVDPDQLRQFSIAVKDAKIGMTDDGCLTAINATFEDRTAQIVTGFIETAVNVAKIAAVGVKAEPDPNAIIIIEEKVLDQVTLKRYVDLKNLTSEPNEGPFVTKYTLKMERDEFTNWFTKTTFSKAKKAQVTVALSSRNNLVELSKATAKDVLEWIYYKKDRPYLEGVLFRIPAPVRIQVLVSYDGTNEVTVYQDDQTFAQAGGFGWIVMKSELFATRQFGLKVSTSTGAVTEYSFAGTSQGEGIATFAKDLSNKGVSAINDIGMARMEWETARLKKETELINARTALEKAKAAGN